MSNSGEEEEPNAGEEVTQCSTSVACINNLNYDCLAEVFKHLSLGQRLEIETVCKHLKEASQFAWNDRTSLTFSTYNSDGFDDVKKLPLILRNTQDAGRILMRCGAHLEKLHIGTPFGCLILSIVAQYCSNLRKLELSFKHFDVNWMQLISNMESLESLEILDFVQDFPQDFFEGLPQALVKISISLSRMLNPLAATSAFRNLQHLRHLELINCHLDDSMVDAICEKYELTHLSLPLCEFSGEPTRLLRLENLQYLNLYGIEQLKSSPSVDDNFVIQLVNSCKKLKWLALCGFEDTDSWDEYSGITNRGLTALQRLPHLEYLTLRDVQTITDEPLGRMVQLKGLECCWCDNVRNGGVIGLIKNATRLDYLNVACCDVTEAVIVEALEVTKKRGSLPLKMILDGRLLKERDVDADKAYSPSLTLIAAD